MAVRFHDAVFARYLTPVAALVAVLVLPISTAEAQTSSAPATEEVAVTGHYLPTDELLSPKAVQQLKPRRLAVRGKPVSGETNVGTWLFDYIGRLIDKEPEAAKRVRTTARAGIAVRVAKGAQSPKMAAAAPMAPLVPASEIIAPAQPAVRTSPSRPIDQGVIPLKPSVSDAAAVVVPEQIKPVSPTVTFTPQPNLQEAKKSEHQVPARQGSEIVTGAVVAMPVLRPEAPASIVTPDASQALVQAAERAQARSDLVKLELAYRTYDERRLSGQSAFDLRIDWRVLERAKDALSGPELAAAEAAGFEANAYINENTRTIVVAIAGSQDLRRDFLQADLWDALIKSQMPQQFFLAKTYVRSVIQRYQMRGFTTECVGHSLGGGACAYAASELNVRAIVVNPIAAGRLGSGARFLVTNYVVDGDIAQMVYGARGAEFSGDVYRISDSNREEVRAKAMEKFGPLAGPILVVRGLSDSVKSHLLGRALDLIAQHAGMERPR